MIRRVLGAADEFRRGEAASSALLDAAWAGERALDNANHDEKRRLQDLALAIDAALDPWPPPPPGDDHRRVVLAAAEPFLAVLTVAVADEA